MTNRLCAAFGAIHADAALIERTAAFCRAHGTRRKRRATPLVPLAAAAALLVVCLLGGGLYFTADAYVSLDVNPSVELVLNRFDRVIDAFGFNEAGAALIEKVDLRGKSYGDAADALLTELAAEGYLQSGAEVTVTVQTASGGREASLCRALEQRIDAGLKQGHHDAALTVFPVTREIWEEAHGCHMSPAQYLKEHDSPPAAPEQDSPPAQTQEDTHGDKQSHPNDHGEPQQPDPSDPAGADDEHHGQRHHGGK